MAHISELINKFKNNIEYYKSENYNETELRQEFLDPLFKLLGWDIENSECRSTYNKEVLLEESLRSSEYEYAKKPDYTFRYYSERRFFLEAKKPSVNIKKNNNPAKQVRRYGYTADLKISILSNFEFTIIYDTTIPVHDADTFQTAILKEFYYEEYGTRFNELSSLIGKESVVSGLFDQNWSNLGIKDTYSIDLLFLDQINRWRVLLGSELARIIPSINDVYLNDICQNYINRILFLRVCEDRHIEDYEDLLYIATKEDFNALLNKFKDSDRKYNSGLFNQEYSELLITDISSPFWSIIREIYYPISPYSFTVLSSDILGHIYEVFLSQKLHRLDDGNIILIDKPEHSDRDVITTPQFIIKHILLKTVKPYCLGKTPSKILTYKFADIACGSGAFLLELYQYLIDLFTDYYIQHDPSKITQIGSGEYKLDFGVKKDILLKTIYGVDKDFNAVEACKLGLLLKLLEDETNDSLPLDYPILPDLSFNIEHGNSLVNFIDVDVSSDLSEINPYDFNKQFDIIVGNPPYMSTEEMLNITPKEVSLYKKKFITAYKQYDKYFLFIERSLSLLKPIGILCYIIPNKFIKVGSGKLLRKLLTDNQYVKDLISFGSNQVFENRTTYTSIIMLSKTKNESFNYLKVDNLIDFKINNISELSELNFPSSKIDSDVWVLLNNHEQKVYDEILKQSVKLKSLVGSQNIFNGIQTSANNLYVLDPIRKDNTYVYFNKNNIEFKIERTVLKPYYQTTKKNSFNTYEKFKPNSYVIYPYTMADGSAELISLDFIRDNYPFAFAYLSKNKHLLNNPKRSVKLPSGQNSLEEWHRYGRHQALDKCNMINKILVGVLSQGNKYCIDSCGTFFSSGGTAGYCAIGIPEDISYSVYYIQAILNSKYVEWICSVRGEEFRGGYISRGTKILKNLPIRKINFNNSIEQRLHDQIASQQEELISLYTRYINSQNIRERNMVKRRFLSLKNIQDHSIKELYQLGTDDALIPTIEQLYAKN